MGFGGSLTCQGRDRQLARRSARPTSGGTDRWRAQHELELAALTKRGGLEGLHVVLLLEVHAQHGRPARHPDLTAVIGGQLLDVAAETATEAARGVVVVRAAAAAAAAGEGCGQPSRLCGGGLRFWSSVRLRVRGQGSGVSGQGQGRG